MFPDLRGTNNCSSQPGMPSLPRMQSLVLHVAQTLSSTTFTSSGETSDCTKLNCPIGQTYLQNAAPRKKPSITKAAAKYPTALKAAHHGLSHKLNASYAHKNSPSSATASHLLLSQRGQLRPAGRKRRASDRGRVNGQARQKKLPAASRLRISRPRQ